MNLKEFYQEPRLPNDDLQAAIEFNISGIKDTDIKNVIAEVTGEHDGYDWHWIFELLDGRFGYITGGCDYTGWD